MEKKEELITSVQTKGISSGIPRVIMETICRLLYDLIHGNTMNIPDHPSLAMAVQSQMAIGTCLFPRGFISTEWLLECLKDFGVPQPEQKMSKLLKLIWFDSTDTLLRNRNEVALGGDGRTQQLERET
jgi:hypothetical protein